MAFSALVQPNGSSAHAAQGSVCGETRLETAHMLDWHILILAVAGLQILVQGGENLRVQHLKIASFFLLPELL